ncbi:hypothetical protein E2C01_028749 [Portunus trituberculatus]|uniref:Uncharacterized protein n=1 Tax=Portunus trituberculatus TaxID=210409 RepID=A0A5B7EPX5_PORTR|nr:hypothetical protein [Portunus trituberculatus]
MALTSGALSRGKDALWSQRGARPLAFIAKIYTALRLFPGLFSLAVDTLLVGAQNSLKQQQAEAPMRTTGGREAQLYDILFSGGMKIGSGTHDLDQTSTGPGSD